MLESSVIVDGMRWGRVGWNGMGGDVGIQQESIGREGMS